MSLIQVEKYNEVYIRVFSDASTEMELSRFFSFKVPGYQFMQKFKAKLWDGNIYLYNANSKMLYAGLINYVKEYATINECELEIAEGIIYDEGITLEEVDTFVKTLNPCTKGTPIEIRDYQLEASHVALNTCRAVLLSPVSSGKSLIIYTLLRWFIQRDMKVLIIVPTTGLVTQLYSDFEDYSTGNLWSTEDNCQKLYSGLSKEVTKNCMITTWQSSFSNNTDKTHKKSSYKKPINILTDMNVNWYNQWDAVICDEAHLASGASITSMFEKMTGVKYRIGTTGTIDTKAQINQLQLEGIMGPIYNVITTRELMDSNRIVQLEIKCILLKHDEAVRKTMKDCTYQEEIDFIVSNENRNKFIANLALKQDGNTLVLFQYVQRHGKVLFKMIEERAMDGRKIFFVSGEVKTEDREAIRKAVECEFDGKIFTFKGIHIKVPNNEKIKMTSGEVKFAKDITLTDDVCDIWIANKIKLSFVK